MINYIQTHTVQKIDLLNPRVGDINITDIAHALSHICRFVGHCDQFYSVAQHSIHVSKELPKEYALWGLLHDAAEAYIGDISQPLKRALGEKIHTIENRILKCVAEKYNLIWPIPIEIKTADTVMLATEARDLMKGGRLFNSLPKPLEEKIIPYSSFEAKIGFLARFMGLTNEH